MVTLWEKNIMFLVYQQSVGPFGRRAIERVLTKLWLKVCWIFFVIFVHLWITRQASMLNLIRSNSLRESTRCWRWRKGSWSVRRRKRKQQNNFKTVEPVQTTLELKSIYCQQVIKFAAVKIESSFCSLDLVIFLLETCLLVAYVPRSLRLLVFLSSCSLP